MSLFGVLESSGFVFKIDKERYDIKKTFSLRPETETINKSLEPTGSLTVEFTISSVSVSLFVYVTSSTTENFESDRDLSL